MAKGKYTKDSAGSAASKAGQLIGEAFERVIINVIQDYIQVKHQEYELLEPDEGHQIVTLETLGGTLRRLDTVIIGKETDDPVALLETKWLKDARHHNDKGAWILQLREVSKKYPTVRGAIAILAGYWTEGVGVVLMSDAGVRMVLVATDEEIYSTLQSPLDNFLGNDTFQLDAAIMRKSYPRPWDFANLLISLLESGELDSIAASWLEFIRQDSEEGTIVTGRDSIKLAIDDLLAPFSEAPNVAGFEIALRINTGNIIYDEFTDMENLLEFVRTYACDPQAILDRITPKKRPKDDQS